MQIDYIINSGYVSNPNIILVVGMGIYSSLFKFQKDRIYKWVIFPST